MANRHIYQALPYPMVSDDQLRSLPLLTTKSRFDLDSRFLFWNNFSFAIMVVAPPGGGKTMFLQRLISNHIEEFKTSRGNPTKPQNLSFHHVFWFIPHYIDGIPLQKDDRQDTWNWATSFHPSIVKKVITKNKTRITPSTAQKLRVLFILDDNVADLDSFKGDRDWMKTMFNRRHVDDDTVSLSFVITTQKLNSIPKWIRDTLSGFVLMGGIPADDAQLFARSHMYVRDIKPKLVKMFEHWDSKAYSWVYITLYPSPVVSLDFEDIIAGIERVYDEKYDKENLKMAFDTRTQFFGKHLLPQKDTATLKGLTDLSSNSSSKEVETLGKNIPWNHKNNVLNPGDVNVQVVGVGKTSNVAPKYGSEARHDHQRRRRRKFRYEDVLTKKFHGEGERSEELEEGEVQP